MYQLPRECVIYTLMVWVFTAANSHLPDEINPIYLNEISTQMCLRNNNYVRWNSSFIYSWFKKLTSVSVTTVTLVNTIRVKLARPQLSVKCRTALHTLHWRQHHEQPITEPCFDGRSTSHETEQSSLSYLLLQCWHLSVTNTRITHPYCVCVCHSRIIS